jgi:hypothetical protein
MTHPIHRHPNALMAGLMAAAHVPSRVAVGDCGGNDYISEAIMRATQCFPAAQTFSPAAPGPMQAPTNFYQPGTMVPGAPGAGPANQPGYGRPCGFGGLPMTCGKLPFRLSYVAGLAAAVAGGAASGLIAVTPKVPFKGLRLVIPGASNWRITSIQVGMTEYIGGGAVPGTFFQDLEVDSGRIDLDWSSPSLPINVNGTNISAGALDFNPGVAGILAN